MDEFIIGQNPAFLLPTICDEILSWMIEIWMKIHLVSDSNCNTLIYNPPIKLQGMTTKVRLTSSIGDTISRFTFSIEQDN